MKKLLVIVVGFFVNVVELFVASVDMRMGNGLIVLMVMMILVIVVVASVDMWMGNGLIVLIVMMRIIIGVVGSVLSVVCKVAECVFEVIGDEGSVGIRVVRTACW